MRKPFVFNGKEYRSATVCGIHLVKDLGKSVSSAASLVGLNYQTIYTKVGKKAIAKRAKLEAKYHAKRLLWSKRHYTFAEIQRRTGLSYLEVKKIFMAKKTTKNAKRGQPAKKNHVKHDYNIHKHVEHLVNTAIPEITNVSPTAPVIVETAPIVTNDAPIDEIVLIASPSVEVTPSQNTETVQVVESASVV